MSRWSFTRIMNPKFYFSNIDHLPLNYLWKTPILINEPDDSKPIENPKKIPIKKSNSRLDNEYSSKNKPLAKNYPDRENLASNKNKSKEDEVKISPWFLLGLAISSLGVGDLLDPNVTAISASAFETWSLIIMGLLIALPGAIVMIRDYIRIKKKKQNKKQS